MHRYVDIGAVIVPVGINTVNMRAVQPAVGGMPADVQMQTTRLHGEHCDAGKGDE